MSGPVDPVDTAVRLEPYQAQIVVEWWPSASIGEQNAVRHLLEGWCGQLMERLQALEVVDPCVELDQVRSGGVSSVTEAPPLDAVSRLREAVAAAHDTGASAVTVDLPTGDDLLALLTESPPPQALTHLEQQVVSSAADWLEQRGNYAAHPDLHSGMLALLMIIDRFCRHGAIRLDEAPAEATEGRPLCGDPSCVCHEEGDDGDGE